MLKTLDKFTVYMVVKAESRGGGGRVRGGRSGGRKGKEWGGEKGGGEFPTCLKTINNLR